MGVDSKAGIGPTAKDMGTKVKSAERARGRRMPKALRNTILSVTAITAGVEGISATATELTDGKPFLDNPAQTIQIGTLQKVGYDLLHPFDWIKNISSVPDTFANKTGSTKFGESNVSRITVEKAESEGLLTPKISINSDGDAVVSMLLPGVFPPNIANAEIKIQNHAEKEQLPYTDAHFIMEEGYKLTLPKGTHYALLQANEGTSQNPNLIYTIVAFFYDPIENVSLTLTYETDGFKPEENQKIIPKDVFRSKYSPSNGGKPEELPLSDGKTIIAIPEKPNQSLNIFMFGEKGKITPSGNWSLQEAQTKSIKTVWESIVNQNQKLVLTSAK